MYLDLPLDVLCSVARFRLRVHNLQYETATWNSGSSPSCDMRPGADEIQDEKHFFFFCTHPQVLQLRINLGWSGYRPLCFRSAALEGGYSAADNAARFASAKLPPQAGLADVRVYASAPAAAQAGWKGDSDHQHTRVTRKKSLSQDI
eukprot:1161953-Pelagomonas_calceolata.AAC.1